MKRAIPLLLLAVALSSCTVRFDSRVEVDADESGTFALEISLDEEFREFAADSGGAADFDFTEGLEDVPAAWAVTEFTDGEFEGFRVAVDFADFADLDRRLAELSATADADSPAPLFLETSGLTRDGDQFVFSSPITGLQDGLTGLGDDSGDFSFEGFDPATLFGQLFQIRFIVTLPGEIGSNNADSVDGNTLIWDIGFDDEGRNLEAVSDIGGGGRLPTGLILGLLVLAAGIVGSVVFRASRRGRRQEPAWMGGATTSPSSTPRGDLGADPFANPADAASGSPEPASVVD
jgi:hypothetical protein